MRRLDVEDLHPGVAQALSHPALKRGIAHERNDRIPRQRSLSPDRVEPSGVSDIDQAHPASKRDGRVT
jgi:hypothetical protein